jgi:hypothetical protein
MTAAAAHRLRTSARWHSIRTATTDVSAAPRTSAYQGPAPRPRRSGHGGGDQTDCEAADQAGAAMRSLRRAQFGDGGAWSGAARVPVQNLRPAKPARLIHRSSPRTGYRVQQSRARCAYRFRNSSVGRHATCGTGQQIPWSEFRAASGFRREFVPFCTLMVAKHLASR